MAWSRIDQEFWRNDRVISAVRECGLAAGVVYQELFLTAGRSSAGDGVLSPGKSAPSYVATLLGGVGIDQGQVVGAYVALRNAGLIAWDDAEGWVDGPRATVKILGWDAEWQPATTGAERQAAYKARQAERARGGNGPSVTSPSDESDGAHVTGSGDESDGPGVTPSKVDGCLPSAGDAIDRQIDRDGGGTTPSPSVQDAPAAAAPRARGAAAGTVGDRLNALEGLPAEMHQWIAETGLMAKSPHVRIDVSLDLVDERWTVAGLRWCFQRIERTGRPSPKVEMAEALRDPVRRAKAKKAYELVAKEHRQSPHHFPHMHGDWTALTRDLAGDNWMTHADFYDLMVARRYYEMIHENALRTDTEPWTLPDVPDRWRTLITDADGALRLPDRASSNVDGPTPKE